MKSFLKHEQMKASLITSMWLIVLCLSFQLSFWLRAKWQSSFQTVGYLKGVDKFREYTLVGNFRCWIKWATINISFQNSSMLD
jgi:hypothetical protein